MEGRRGRKGVSEQNKVTHLLLLSTLVICDATSPKVPPFIKRVESPKMIKLTKFQPSALDITELALILMLPDGMRLLSSL